MAVYRCLKPARKRSFMSYLAAIKKYSSQYERFKEKQASRVGNVFEMLTASASFKAPKKADGISNTVHTRAIALIGEYVYDKVMHIDAQGQGGDTLLHIASKSGDRYSVAFLLALGANSSILNGDSKTARDVACTQMNIYPEDEEDVFELERAYKKHQGHFFKKPLCFCQDPAFEAFDNLTNLYLAPHANLDAVKAVSDWKSEIAGFGDVLSQRVPTLFANMRLHARPFASEHKDREEAYEDAMAYVMDGILKIDSPEDAPEKDTLLHIACKAGDADMVAFLLALGADPNIFNGDLATPKDVTLLARPKQKKPSSDNEEESDCQDEAFSNYTDILAMLESHQQSKRRAHGIS